MSVKENQAKLKELIQWAFANYQATDHHLQHQLRSGEVWTWHLEVLPLPEAVSGWPGSQMALRMRRSVARKKTGAVRCTGFACPDRGSSVALTSLQVSAKQLYTLGIRRWERMPRYSRKGAAGLMHLEAAGVALS